VRDAATDFSDYSWRRRSRSLAPVLRRWIWLEPGIQNEEIIFYQMNGLMLGTWLQSALEGDMQRSGLSRPGAFALAHNVPTEGDVQIVIERLTAAGGKILRDGDAPPHGGFRGYVADPDDHAWEIAWNPGWVIDDRGFVTFG
jgi:hypothetical protein